VPTPREAPLHRRHGDRHAEDLRRDGPRWRSPSSTATSAPTPSPSDAGPSYSPSFFLSSSLTRAGLPLPFIALITWPTKKPKMCFFPALYFSTSPAFFASTSSTPPRWPKATSMRIILCCLGLLFAAPAFANSVEDGLCQARPQPVEKMEKSEKLCRAFVRAMGKVPGETMKEVQAMVSPESLTLMGTMTTAWLGSQGIPVLGQTVDATLLTLGVAMAAAQTAAVKESLWNYVHYASAARDESGLDTAATHLARAVTTVGVSVVTFILMKKVSGKIQKQPGPPEPPPLLLPEPVLVASGGRVGNSVRAAPGVMPGTGVAPSLAVAGGRSGDERVLPENAKPKKVDLKGFIEWMQKVKRRPVPENREAYQYQRKHTGPEEMLVSGGGEQVWADGARMDSARLVEVKHISAADNSPFVPDSKCDDYVRTMIQDEVAEEFSRYAAVINDPRTPAVALEVVLNESKAVPFFESLLQRFGIPGEVLVRP
jgi:restriction endonuclease fold toxin 2 of polymorphic toxin system